jgi:hypothetical protein
MAAVEEMCGVVGDEECEIAPINKPRRRKTSVTKRSDIKAQRTRGEEHVNHVEKIVPERVVGPDCRYVMSANLSR